jgi:hypothetical protein
MRRNQDAQTRQFIGLTPPHFDYKMFKKIIALYREYKAYVRVDLVMYAVMILLIILYAIYTLAVS